MVVFGLTVSSTVAHRQVTGFPGATGDSGSPGIFSIKLNSLTMTFSSLKVPMIFCRSSWCRWFHWYDGRCRLTRR